MHMEMVDHHRCTNLGLRTCSPCTGDIGRAWVCPEPSRMACFAVGRHFEQFGTQAESLEICDLAANTQTSSVSDDPGCSKYMLELNFTLQLLLGVCGTILLPSTISQYLDNYTVIRIFQGHVRCSLFHEHLK